ARATRLVVTTTTRVSHAALATSRVATKITTEVFTVEPSPWDGLDYAMLANNINCIMCHTTVDDARRIYDSGGLAAEGAYQRARVGSIESLHLRNDPDSDVAGTIYIGDLAVDANGDPITDWSGLSFRGGRLDDDGRVIEDGLGGAILDALAPADPSDPAPYENLYVDYLDLPEPVDGVLPDRFPLPFLDDGGFDPTSGAITTDGAGNRRIDDNEFAATAARFTGTVSGGAIGVAPSGTRVTSAADAADLAAGNTENLSRVTEGNVILTGSSTEPIRIDGDVAIDGDLVISGPIEGSGSLWVRGNVYVRGDLEYADAIVGSERQFGLGEGGSLNALGLTAGGNVVMGDPYRPSWDAPGAVDGTPDARWNFVLEQTALFNRDEWLKTQAQLPGEPTRVQTGTRTVRRELRQRVTVTESEPVYEDRPTGETRREAIVERVQVGTREEPVFERRVVRPATDYRPAETERVQVGVREVPVYEERVAGYRNVPITERVLVGHRDVERTRRVPYDPPRYESREEPVFETVRPMYANPRYRGPDYVARYYAFDSDAPVPIMNKEGHFDPDTGLWSSEEFVGGWDEDALTLADPNDPSDPTLYPVGGTAAVVEDLGPTAGWIEPDALRGLIEESLGGRDADQSFRVDATLYSANSIFGVIPDSDHAGTNGELRVQGALLAADLGLLAQNGTEVLYDPRGPRVLDIRDESRIELYHSAAVPEARP
ncbi:MAG: hypothetical protein AAFP22_07580, partial [Planctomycetota bacterium]